MKVKKVKSKENVKIYNIMTWAKSNVMSAMNNITFPYEYPISHIYKCNQRMGKNINSPY